MTLHPALLHARAALWSLSRALQSLTVAAHARHQADAAWDDLGTLQAWQPGTGGSGGHADPVPTAVLDHIGPGGTNPYASRHRWTMETATWAARQLLATRYAEGGDPLVQLRQHLPAMTPPAADAMRRWIEDEDTAVRRLLGERDDRQLLPGVPCPACDSAGALALRSSAPEAERVVVCTQLCPCIGQACPCGMGVRAAGAAHVWTLGEVRRMTDYGPTPADEGAAA